MKSLIAGVLVLFSLILCSVLPAADFNGDGKDDIAIFRESSGLWAIRGVTRVYFGQKIDIPIPGDYGGGAADEIAIFRPGSGLWAVKGLTRAYYGRDGDIPLAQSGLKQSGNFFYDPAKGAFRAGFELSDWGDENVGQYSVALGARTIASGWGSFALGQSIVVSGDNSFGFGTPDSFGQIVSQSKVFVIHGAKVGIGTVSPETSLHVEGDENDGITATLKISSGNQDMLLDGNEIDSNSDLYLNRNSIGDVIMVTGGGKVGIGTTNPGAPLNVTANRAAYVAEFINDGNNANRSGIYIQCGSDTGIGDSYLMGFFDGNGDAVGGISFSGGAVTYGTFTADHEAAIPEEKNQEGYPYGTVMCLQAVRSRPERPRQVDYLVRPSRRAYDKAVFGVYAGKHEEEVNTHTIYALGDGQILVTGEGGDIEVGDYLATSNKEGYAMKQSDDLLHSYTVAKALENVDWKNEEGNTRLIACTYHAQ